MNKRCRNIYFNILRRVLAIIVLFVTIAVVLYPGGKVFAVANWDGMPGTYQIDLTGTPIPAGQTYKYEKPLTGLPGSNALFRDSKPDAIEKNLDKAFDMPESAGTNFGELELVDNYLIYTPASDLPTMEVKVLLQLCTVGKSKNECLLFSLSGRALPGGRSERWACQPELQFGRKGTCSSCGLSTGDTELSGYIPIGYSCRNSRFACWNSTGFRGSGHPFTGKNRVIAAASKHRH